MNTEVDEARLLLAAVAMHGLVSSPQQYSIDAIAKDSVVIADKLLDELERTQK